mgnify:CR=1 FL=1
MHEDATVWKSTDTPMNRPVLIISDLTKKAHRLQRIVSYKINSYHIAFILDGQLLGMPQPVDHDRTERIQ